ncbi:hypothetical protein HD806DRAFT_16998 [Xylariaceae sp. AK1471]|nr:hypothetical protein HD806DRAFT_16998 [Xylariaceae sp. AK1471]
MAPPAPNPPKTASSPWPFTWKGTLKAIIRIIVTSVVTVVQMVGLVFLFVLVTALPCFWECMKGAARKILTHCIMMVSEQPTAKVVTTSDRVISGLKYALWDCTKGIINSVIYTWVTQKLGGAGAGAEGGAGADTSFS